MEKKKKQRTKKHEGEIYLVSPRHVVAKKDIDAYNKLKGDKAKNKRLVMVGVEKSGKKVQLSNMTTKTTQKELVRKQHIKLKYTYPSKESFVETNTTARSKATNKKFRIGSSPLVAPVAKVHDSDLANYKKARKQRKR